MINLIFDVLDDVIDEVDTAGMIISNIGDGIFAVNDRDKIKFGDHILTPRGVYSHHGIYIGSGKVIHYDGDPERDEKFAKISVASLDYFAGEKNIISLEEHDDVKFTREEIVARAHYRLGEMKYDLFNNNCQHFALWCCGIRVGSSGSCHYYPEIDMEIVMRHYKNILQAEDKKISKKNIISAKRKPPRNLYNKEDHKEDFFDSIFKLTS